ncbi:ferritin-like domain-containing protein [Halomarina halobia]|uniref:Ferritin-like domain-containing protein n=1 Tax=Halomarina halobia TaxID=3033386 RepID=A0ABD6AE69_9EURY|nr:ferritin-like domain-containing protein [Halomarina sp. PSR21]
MNENDTDVESEHGRIDIKRVIDEVQDRGPSRRTFLAGTAVAGAGALGLSPLTGASSDDNEGNATAGGNKTAGKQMGMGDVHEMGTDVDVLNYALTLEHLEDVFYREFLNDVSKEEFVNSEALQNFNAWEKRASYDFIEKVGEHESTHVEVLTKVIQTLGGEPVPACTYNFGVESVGEYLTVAQALENTGVAAYDGALALIESPDLTTASATIATVEARHASFLNFLNGDVPFPGAFDDAKAAEEILAIAGQFIESCPEEMGAKPENGTQNG